MPTLFMLRNLRTFPGFSLICLVIEFLANVLIAFDPGCSYQCSFLITLTTNGIHPSFSLITKIEQYYDRNSSTSNVSNVPPHSIKSKYIIK